jgi:hypothetical protein
MSEIQAGDGWRLLGDEPVQALSDECYWPSDKTWHPVSPMYNLWKASTFVAVRRRIPAKPEAMETYYFRLEVDSKSKAAAFENFDEPAEFDAAEARQIADWLTRYADWREAQDSK